MYRIIVATLLVLCISISTGHAFKNEPTGFRNIPWGTSIEEVRDQMIFCSEGVDGSGMKHYTRKDEPLEFDAAKVTKVAYTFWNDKLYGVTVIFKLNFRRAEIATIS